MQFQFFTIPASSPDETSEELNRFLRSHRVLTVNREFVADPANPRWCLAVEYLGGEGGSNRTGGKRSIDYREALTPEDFALYVKLRDWRKSVAEREGVPVYTVFTNDQLAKIAGGRISSKAGLAELDGVGAGRVNKYGDQALEIVKTQSEAQSKEARSDEKDC